MNKLDNDIFIHHTACLYGKYDFDSQVSIWPNVVIRSEDHFVQIGKCTNIQDGTIIHVGYKHPVKIGKNCTIGHRVLIHGATIGNDCIIGSGAMIMDGAVIENGCIIETGAIIKEGQLVTNKMNEKAVERKIKNRFLSLMYYENAIAYSEGNYRLWSEKEFKSKQRTVLMSMMADARK